MEPLIYPDPKFFNLHPKNHFHSGVRWRKEISDSFQTKETVEQIPKTFGKGAQWSETWPGG